MLRAGGFGVPGRSWFRDTSKMRSCLDKNLSFEKEPCDYIWRKRISGREE